MEFIFLLTPVPDTNENPQTHILNIHVEKCNVSEGAQLSLPVNIYKDRKSDRILSKILIISLMICINSLTILIAIIIGLLINKEISH